MAENKNFDLDELMDELSSRLEDVLEDAIEDVLVDQVENAVFSAVEEAISQNLSRCELVLRDGTVIRPKPQMKLLSPDKTKMLLCYGGLRVDKTALHVQTGPSCWEDIAVYPDPETAVAALIRVKEAMSAGVELFEL